MKKFITNGIITKKIDINDSLPEGFHFGRTFKNNAWNKGLTAKTDVRVKKNSEAAHKTRKLKDNYIAWNKGLTKENSNSLKIVAQKVSLKNKGKQSWNKGIPLSETRKLQQSLIMSSTGMQERINNKKKQNNSFNTSKPEDLLYNYLIEKYDVNDVFRQYNKDSRYPFNCDFYIKSKDLFIELNLFWMHGPEPFNIKNPNHLGLLNKWKSKALGSNKAYKNAIQTWTVRDVRKLECAKKNNLNYLSIYSLDINNIDI